MPKIVDHDERRRQIADALRRVIDKQGLDAVSLREVAAEADVSMRMIQHYFATKDQMLLFTLNHVTQQIGARIIAAQQPDPRAMLRVAIHELLPLDEERRSESRVMLAFLARSTVTDELATHLSTALQYVVDFYAGLIRDAQAAGLATADLDPDQEAAILFPLMSGLAHSALIGHRSPEQIVATLDYQFTRIFGPKRR